MKRRSLISVASFLFLLIMASPIAAPPAPAAPLRLTLNCDANPDHVCDSQNPCLDGVTNCRNLTGVEWDHSALRAALAVIANQAVGNATDIPLAGFCLGVNCGSATYALRFAVATWSIGGTGTSHLLNDGMTAGNSATSGPIQVQVCFNGGCDTEVGFDWSYQESVNDTTAPPIPVGLTQSGSSSGTATLEFQSVADASGNAPSSGMSRYSIRNTATGAEIASLNAAGPGLLLSFTAMNVGSATGGYNDCTQSGLTWTIRSTGSGWEQLDQAETCGAPVTGDFTAIGTVTSFPWVADWQKVGFDARASSASDAMAATLYLMRSAYGYQAQADFRTATGNDWRSAGGSVLVTSDTSSPGPLPLKLMLRRHGDLWDGAYSTDGQTWNYVMRDRTQVLPQTLYVGPAATPTSLGTQLTAQMTQVSISNTGRVSKTLTLAAATSVAVRAVDVAGNLSANSVAITLTPGSGGSLGAKKWHPGYYVMTPRNYSTRYSQSTRFDYYDAHASEDFAGWNFLVNWAQLEGATHGDYSAGDAMLLAEISHLKNLTSPKRLQLQIDDELYDGNINFYPAYLVNAGCVYQALWSDNIHWLFHFKWWIPTCAGYYADLMTHLGALLDGEPYFETLTLDYEQALSNDAVNGGDGAQFTRSGFMAGLATTFAAAAAAFPHTNLAWQTNWGVTFHEQDIVDEIAIAKPLGIGLATEDACSYNPVTDGINYGTFPIYQDSQNVFAGYGGYDTGHMPGTYTDQRGAMFGTFAVENSELGYNSVCGGQGFAGYATDANGLRAQGYMSLYHEWEGEWNSHARVEWNQEIGTDVQRWSVGVTGSLWDMVINHPLTHTDCPTDYNTLFGNGTAGSGCNTGNEPPPPPPPPGGSAAKKWHPGYYMETCLSNNCLGYRGNPSNGQATRFAYIDEFGQLGSPNIKGVFMPKKWVEMEPTHGDYTTGINLLKADIERAKNEPNPLRYSFFFIDEPNYSFCQNSTCQKNFFPQYIEDAGCLESHESVNYPGSWVTYFRYDFSQCAQYYVDLINALGAALDDEPYLEEFQLDYEQAYELQLMPGFDRTNWMNGVKAVMQAAAAAFPHTNLAWQGNWGVTYVGADVHEVMDYAQAHQIGFSDQDACDRDPDSYAVIYGTFPKYIDADNIFAGYGGYDTDHQAGLYRDQRGKMFSAFGVENSEQGYNSVCGQPGFVGYAPPGSPLRPDYMSLYHNWESLWVSHAHVFYNTWIGIPEQQWSEGLTGSLSDLVRNHPLTHTDCPTDYTSGCNTGDTPPPPPGQQVHKWHPGMYMRAHTTRQNCGAACDPQRHAQYPAYMGDANVKGTSIWIYWKDLESAAGGDFSSGFAWLHNELNYIKTTYPGKQVGLLLDFSPYGYGLAQINAAYPQYFINAGCVYDENSAQSGGGNTSLNWYKDNATCRNYYKRLIAAYGAEFDSEPVLEWVRIQQETDDAINCCGINGAAEDAGWKDITLATVTAFPTTQVQVPMNWVGVETAANKEALLAYYKSIGAAVGDGDTIPAPVNGYPSGYPCPSTAWGCVVRGLNASLGASNHDYCGEFVSMSSLELSEFGYQTVPGGPGLSAQDVVEIANTQRCAQYLDWDINLNEITDDACGGCTQYWLGAMGQKWAIDNIPLTHTQKPAGYR